eukprot:7455224-Pyramimonas_sp.AAC.1
MDAAVARAPVPPHPAADCCVSPPPPFALIRCLGLLRPCAADLLTRPCPPGGSGDLPPCPVPTSGLLGCAGSHCRPDS